MLGVIYPWGFPLGSQLNLTPPAGIYSSSATKLRQLVGGYSMPLEGRWDYKEPPCMPPIVRSEGSRKDGLPCQKDHQNLN